MRYMYLILTTDDAPPSPPRLIEEMNKLAGNSPTMMGGGALLPTAGGARIRLKDGKIKVTDGPFTETKEVIAGYAIFEFDTREQAIESAVSFIELHRLHGEGWEGACEMREML